jgi:hypothetical protein
MAIFIFSDHCGFAFVFPGSKRAVKFSDSWYKIQFALEREFIAGTQENILLMSAATICIGNKFNLQHCYSVLVHIRTAIT